MAATIDDLIDKLSSLTDSFNGIAERLGYIGELGGEAQFDKRVIDNRKESNAALNRLKTVAAELKNNQDKLDLLEKENALQEKRLSIQQEITKLQNATNNIDTERVSALNDELDNVNNLLSTISQIKVDYNDINQLKTETNNLQEEAKNLTREYLTEKDKEKRTQDDINESLKYQNKELKEGLTLEDRINYFVSKRSDATKSIIKHVQTGFGEMRKGFNETLTAVNKILEPWSKVDHNATNFGRAMGMNRQQIDAYRNSLIRFAADSGEIAAKYGKDANDLIQMQESVNVAIGRNAGFSYEDQENMAAMATLSGSNESAVKFATSLENFGLNPTESAKQMELFYKSSMKHGVAFKKVSDNFLSNIKMAQNYTFKNGLSGLASMAEKAAAIKLDMGQASRFADKISTLEGAVSAAANLSVLGGSFGVYSNPMQLLYEGLNDTEAAMDRLVGMFGKLGTFNNQTGEVEVSAFNRQRIKAAASAIGVDPSNMMEMIYANTRREYIKPQIASMGYSRDDEEAILNNSFVKGGQSLVSIGGETINIAKTKLDEKQLAILRGTSDDQAKNIKQIAQSVMSYKDRVESLQKSIEAHKANFINGTIADLAVDTVNELRQHTKFLAAIGLGVTAITGILGTLRIGNGVGNLFSGTFSNANKAGTVAKGAAAASGASGARQAAAGAGAGFKSALRSSGTYASGVLGGALTAWDEFGSDNHHTNSTKYGRTAAGVGTGILSAMAASATTGALSGSVAPGIGNAIGFGVGALVGLGGYLLGNHFIGGDDEERAIAALEKINSNPNSPIHIRDHFNYDADELEIIADYSKLKDSPKVKQKLIKNGDVDIVNGDIPAYKNGGLVSIGNHDATPIINQNNVSIPEIPAYKDGGVVNNQHINNSTQITPTSTFVESIAEPKINGKYAEGGLINGSGTDTSDSNIALVSNNEYIMPAKQVRQGNNLEVLDQMRSGVSFEPIIQPLKNSLNVMKVSETRSNFNNTNSNSNTNTNTRITFDSIKFEPLTIRLEGLDKSYSKTIDSDALANSILNNSQLMMALTRAISKNDMVQRNFGYDKNNFWGRNSF